MSHTIKKDRPFKKYKGKIMSWAKYEKYINKEWANILNEQNVNENMIQIFFEKNPCMVPGAYGIMNPSGHFPFPYALISQPPLPTFSRKVPDFMWISIDSGTIRPILIEIEKPTKRWGKKNGKFSSTFTEAWGQLAEWRDWFNKDGNISSFKSYYKLPNEIYDKPVKPFYVLIYGRKSELDQNKEVNLKRVNQSRDDEELMTFDRIIPQKDISELMCVKLKIDEYKKVGFEAISVPPTFKIQPDLHEYLKLIRGKEKAVNKNRFMSNKRKKFLIQRFKHWDEFKEDRDIPIYPAGSYE